MDEVPDIQDSKEASSPEPVGPNPPFYKKHFPYVSACNL
jgi:hypothetical protein